MKIEAFHEELIKAFSDLPFTVADAVKAIPRSRNNIEVRLDALVYGGKIFCSKSILPRLYSTKPFRRGDALLDALDVWRAAFGRRWFSKEQAASAFGVGERWAQSALNKLVTRGNIARKKDGFFSFEPNKIGRPKGVRDKEIRDCAGKCRRVPLLWRSKNRVDVNRYLQWLLYRLRKEFASGNAFDAEGCAELYEVPKELMEGFLLRLATRGDIAVVGSRFGSREYCIEKKERITIEFMTRDAVYRTLLELFGEREFTTKEIRLATDWPDGSVQRRLLAIGDKLTRRMVKAPNGISNMHLYKFREFEESE